MNSPQWRRGQSITCSSCGQIHRTAEPHIYDYIQEVDEDLVCQICLQPLVAPTDTKCGHTFCHVCLSNYLLIQPLCPLDRTYLTLGNCQPASLMVKRLLDKLIVQCPSTHCTTVLPRGELEDHLKHRCSSSSKTSQDIGNHKNHNLSNHKTKSFKHPCSSISLLKPDGEPQLFVAEGELSKIEIRGIESSLGVRIVGGCDSPLRCIVIQEISPDGLFAQDGRLKPGDQLIEVNGDDLTCCTHMQACSALIKAAPVLLLVVYRDRADSYSQVMNEEVHRIVLTKNSREQIGCKISEKRYEPGVYISELLEKSVAERSFEIDDRILEINGQDVRNASVQEAYSCLQATSRKVELLISRCANAAGEGATFGSLNSPHNASSNADSLRTRRSSRPPPERPMQPKYFTIAKAPDEPLGISVAGGLHGPNSDTPIYISNFQLQGAVGRSGQIKKGDILLSVNGASLLGITHAEAITELKAAAPETSVVLGIVDGPETTVSYGNFNPTWMYWQNLPRILHMPKTVVLNRNSSGSLGFSIVGGKDSVYGDQPIHVLLVVHDSPAALEGKLKCGDQILSVNGHRLDGVRHTTAVAMLKQAKTRVVMEVLSWPGSQV